MRHAQLFMMSTHFSFLIPIIQKVKIVSSYWVQALSQIHLLFVIAFDETRPP